MALLFHYLRKIEGIIIMKVIKFKDSLTFVFLMFLGEFAGGLIVFLYLHFSFSSLNKEKSDKNDESQEKNEMILIHEKRELPPDIIIDKRYKIFILIFFSAFFDFIQFVISHYFLDIGFISPTFDQRLCTIITIISSLLCTYALKIKTGRHHNFSLIGMSICSFIIFIIELIYKARGTNFTNFIFAFLLVLCKLSFVSFSDVVERYLVQYDSFDKFKVLCYEGFFGFILCLIYCFIIPKNPFTEIDKVYKNLNVGMSILLILFLIIYSILSSLLNIYKITCNIIYTPMVKSLVGYVFNPFLIIYYFSCENDFVSENEQNYFYFISNIFLSIFIIVFAFIYNEFFIIKCCDLERDTHYGITKRSIINSMEPIEIERFNSEIEFEDIKDS